MFETTKEDLKDILRKVVRGQMQLPDFQRDYVWQDEDVRSLIASIAKGYPVGALLTLQTGGEVNFKPRLIEGVDCDQPEPEELLLDGQQRITSLFQAMFSEDPVKTLNKKKKGVERYYYIDIEKSLQADADIYDAIEWVPGSKIKKARAQSDELDLSAREAEFEYNLFPLNLVFDSHTWLYDWRDYWRQKPETNGGVDTLERRFYEGILERIQRYEMPIIRLDRRTSRGGICLVFEKVNVGGKKLDAFELLTAIYAADEFDLRIDWFGSKKHQIVGRRKSIIGIQNRRDVVSNLASTDFLQACTILYTRTRRLAAEQEDKIGRDLPQVNCSRSALLALPLESYRRFADEVQKGFIEAAEFLHELKIIWHKDVPYPPIIVALAATFAILGHEAHNMAAKKRLEHWFWSVTMSEQYGSATDSKLARDVPELVLWIRGQLELPRSVDEAYFQKDRLYTLRTRISAAYKGLHALLMRFGCEDFISGRQIDVMTFFSNDIDIHHVFPRAWCIEQRIEPERYNSIINKTPLSSRSNRIIGGNAPSLYLRDIEDKHQIAPEDLDEILRTHLIEPEHLRNDDFEASWNARTKALADLVANAMGKSVIDESEEDEPEEEIELPEFDQEDLADAE